MIVNPRRFNCLNSGAKLRDKNFKRLKKGDIKGIRNKTTELAVSLLCFIPSLYVFR